MSIAKASIPPSDPEVTPSSDDIWSETSKPWQEELRIDELTLDADLQMREGIDDAAVERYRIAYAEGERMPPLGVVSTGEHYLLIDGFHRVRAAKQAGLHNLDCHIREGSRQEAFRFALGMNRTHGLPRSRADTRKAIEAALTNTETRQLSDRAIAKLVGCSGHTVGSVRKELEATAQIAQSDTRVGADGREIRIGNIGGPTAQFAQSDDVARRLIPPAGHGLSVWGLGDCIIWIEPDAAEPAEWCGECLFFVSVLHMDEDHGGTKDGTHRGIPGWFVRRMLTEKFGINGDELDSAEIREYRCEPLTFNRWLFDSYEDHVADWRANKLPKTKN